MWEKVNQEEVGEARIEQMRKMHDIKATMPAKEAEYYDSVSSKASFSFLSYSGDKNQAPPFLLFSEPSFCYCFVRLCVNCVFQQPCSFIILLIVLDFLVNCPVWGCFHFYKQVCVYIFRWWKLCCHISILLHMVVLSAYAFKSKMYWLNSLFEVFF